MEKIILFGRGKYFNKKINLLNKYEIVEILDSKCKNETSFEDTGIPIINPSEAVPGSEKIYLMSMYFVSMWKQLVTQGINPHRLIYPFFEKPYFQSDEIVDQYVSSIEFSMDFFTVHCKDGRNIRLQSQNEWDSLLREFYRDKFELIGTISQMSATPISRQFATERGTPVDRYYIDEFLKNNNKYICGDVLEIEDSTYTRKFGTAGINKSIVMDVSLQSDNIDFNANLETGEGIADCIADCFICTQTLMYIYDLETAVHNIMRLLKPNGVALITCSGLSQNSERCMESYGAYWGFNEAVFHKMFSKESRLELINTETYGNCKTVLAHIAGLCVEDLKEADFIMQDKCYPLVCCAVVRKI